MTPHAQKIVWLFTAVGAVTGSWLDTAQTHISLIVLVVTGLTGFVLLYSAVLRANHDKTQLMMDAIALRKMQAEEVARLAAEKRAAEDLVCEERRRTGICPKSTFHPEKHG